MAARWRLPLSLMAAALFAGGLFLSIRSLGLTLAQTSLGPALLILAVLGPLSLVSGAVGLQMLARALGRRIGFLDALTATAVGAMTELLPIPGGALVRGAALIRAGAGLGESAWIVTLTAILSLAMSAVLAGAALIANDNLLGYGLFSAGAAGSLVCVIWIARRAGPRLALAMFALRVVNLVLIVARIVFSFAAIGVSVGPLAAALLALSPVLGSTTSIVPAGIGVSEMIAAALATLVAISPAAAFTAVALNRVLGLACCAAFALVLARRIGRGDRPRARRGEVMSAETLACPICCEEGQLALRQRDLNKSIRPDLEHELFECGRCGLFYQRLMDLDLLLSFYPESYYEKAHGRLFRWIGSVRNALRAHAVGWRARKGRVIDVGCGAGTLLRSLKGRGWTVVGMDWNPANAARVAKAVGCEVAAGPDGLDNIPEKSLQVVSMMHVLEHEQEPGQLLSAAHRILEPGGRIVVAVPNAASLTRTLFGQYWAGYDLPRHRRIFTPRSLQACLKQCGFQVERTTGRFSDEWLDLLRSAYLFSRERGLGGRVVPLLLTGALFLPVTAASLLGYGSVMFMFAKRR